ncbi:MAG: hypothetical protein WCY33_02780 [Clostridia bacterium]|jgi:hypothetical protein
MKMKVNNQLAIDILRMLDVVNLSETSPTSYPFIKAIAGLSKMVANEVNFRVRSDEKVYTDGDVIRLITLLLTNCATEATEVDGKKTVAGFCEML